MPMPRQDYKQVAARLAEMGAEMGLIKTFADVLGPLNPRFDRDQFIADAVRSNPAPRRRFGDRRPAQPDEL